MDINLTQVRLLRKQPLNKLIRPHEMLDDVCESDGEKGEGVGNGEVVFVILVKTTQRSRKRMRLMITSFRCHSDGEAGKTEVRY